MSGRVTSSATGAPPSPVPRPPSAPWPEAMSSGIHTGQEAHALPRASQDLVASFATSALSRHSRVSDKLKAQIWSGEYVSISSLLHDSSPQNYSVSVRPGSDDETPMFCVAPRAKSSTVSVYQWLQGFKIYMSVFLLQPQHLSESHNLLMYVQTIRSLYEKGADWRSYDEAFRSLRQANNWGWESVCWYLWMNASESRPAATPSVTPFRSKGKASWGKARWPSTSVDAVVASTQRHDAIGNVPNPILLDRVQPPASLRPNRRLPVRDQPSSGDSMPTPVSPDALRYVLVGYNRNIVEYLLNGFQHGFRIGCLGLPAQQAKRVTNLKSAIEFPAVVDNKIAKELALGRILGPFDTPPPCDSFRISPLG